MNRVERLMAYLLLLQNHGLQRAQDFAHKFEISERTVYRDMQALSEMGVPLISLPGEGYRLMEGYYLPPIRFSGDEARSLYLAISMLIGFVRPGATQQAAQTALEKVRAVLPTVSLQKIEALEAMIRFYAFPNASLDFDDPKLLAFQEAIQQRRVVELQYHAGHNNEVTTRQIEPLELTFLDKTWLLTAYCRLRQEIRSFRLDRIDTFQLKEETFTPRFPMVRLPLDSTRIITVSVRFPASVKRWVQEQQHFTFVEETSDGLMHYHVRNMEQLIGWLLSWGNQFEVIEPAALRQQIAALAAQIGQNHGKLPAKTKIKPSLS